MTRMHTVSAVGVAGEKPGEVEVFSEATGSVLPAAAIPATSDAQAVSAWLREYRGSPQTLRTYRREAERLLLWLAEQGIDLKSLRRHHLDDFEAFLCDPQPRERWVGPVKSRQSSDWKPFRGPLSASSRRQSLVILQGMMSWLKEAGWIAHNPFRLMRDKRRRLDNQTGRVERYLERPLWDWLWAWLSRPLPDAASLRERKLWTRRRLVFGFAYLMAPRISEMSQARMSDLFVREGRWWWRVIGKGAKTAEIPVPEDMMLLIRQIRVGYGLPENPGLDDGPILRRLDGKSPLGENQLYRLIRTTFSQAADVLEQEGGDALAIMRLRQATPHWLRHTALTHQAQAGVELRYLAATARHARLDTTSRYLHTEDEEWHRQQSWHRLPGASKSETGDDAG